MCVFDFDPIVDRGVEFTGAEVRLHMSVCLSVCLTFHLSHELAQTARVLTEKGIRHVTSQAHWKNKVAPVERLVFPQMETPSLMDVRNCALVCRLNRTIRVMLGRLRASKSFISLPDAMRRIEKSLNSSRNSTTGLVPSETTNEDASKLMTRQRDKRQKEVSTNYAPPIFQVGQLVRVKRQKAPFDKSDIPQWSTAIYRISGIKNTLPAPSYHLVSVASGDDLLGSYSQRELTGHVELLQGPALLQEAQQWDTGVMTRDELS